MGLGAWLRAEVDGASVGFLRAFLGLIFAGSAVRFLAKGWVEPLYLEPILRFPYPGFGWVPFPGEAGLYGLFGVMILGGLMLAQGRFTRLGAGLFFVAFTWVELLDLTTYLNHYYLVSLLALLFVVLPTRGPTVPRLTLWTLRAQLGLVYVFAGIAKLEPDWLLHGEPLHTWLAARADLPVLGGLLEEPATAVAMAWGGLLYDLSIPLWLSWRRTRVAAWATVVFFHLSTWILFPIGIFPWLMMGASTVFWSPDWPRRFTERAPVDPGSSPSARATPALLAFCAVWLAVQVALPLRAFAQPGELTWTERGFRFSWRVMLIEKTGLVEYRLVDRDTGERWVVHPRDRLTPLQLQEMSTQPDMIAWLGRRLAWEWGQRDHDVAVFADVFVSLNGRPSQRMLDPEVDLSRPLAELPEHWILPLEAASLEGT